MGAHPAENAERDRVSVRRQLARLGHELIVAHGRNVRLIGDNSRKDDRFDDRTRAQLARIDPRLLSPVPHRTKSYGERQNSGRGKGLSQQLRDACDSLSTESESLNEPIAEYDRRTEQVASEVYTQVALSSFSRATAALTFCTGILKR